MSDRSIDSRLVEGERGRRFKGFLSHHPKYNVARRNSMARDPLQGGKVAWARTSKAGLEFQVRRGGTIHFVIDDIKLDDVARKEGYGTSITASELRWLYRHRRTHQVRSCVRFWNRRGEVTQPSFFGRAEWRDYVPTHVYEDSDDPNDWRTVENKKTKTGKQSTKK